MRFILSVLILGLSLYSYSAHAEVIIGKARIVDGDTFKVNGETIRLFGIDAPEAGQKCNKRGGGKWACGKEAIEFLKRVLRTFSNNFTIRCTYDERDDYGRPLAKCSMVSKNRKRRLVIDSINQIMVRSGYAWAFRKYSMKYAALEDRVKRNSGGVWQAPTMPPWEYRAQKWKVAAQEAPKGCPIKGNINRKQEKIYHAPWSPWYTRTKVSLKKGERWFCSEADAIRAGWRAPHWG